MRNLVLFSLVLIGFLNVSTVSHGTEPLTTLHEQVLLQIDTDCNSRSSHQVPAENSTSHTHQCHFGHCAFLLAVESDMVNVFAPTKHNLAECTFILTAFSADLFRPPII
ncbi:MAG: hypothetical protein SGJ18_00835 [Pseudomonadota bacterium]|nr:hypothetical protein [Pseudomonadota bacterium]